VIAWAVATPVQVYTALGVSPTTLYRHATAWIDDG
jgi:hypothetical protein